MKLKFKTVLTLLLAVISLQVQAADQFIRGDMHIVFNSVKNDKPVKGVNDNYSLNINVSDDTIFNGTITDLPLICDGWFSKTVSQQRKLEYNIDCNVVNPKNHSQTKDVGTYKGEVPISQDGVYQYSNGSLKVDILPMGHVQGFTSKCTGSAAGKPLIRPPNWLDTLKRDAVNITQTSKGKTSVLVLTKYDKMEFIQHVVPGGPWPYYSDVTVNGTMLYDYDKKCWFFNNVSMSYATTNFVTQYDKSGNQVTTTNNATVTDKVSGTIRWVKDKDRVHNGLGEYDFDIRVNEPTAGADAVFSAGVSSGDSFFDTDDNVPGLTGTIKYHDAVKPDGSDDPPATDSQIAIDLKGNKLTPQQTMALCKIVIFSSVVPMNSN